MSPRADRSKPERPDLHLVGPDGATDDAGDGDGATQEGAMDPAARPASPIAEARELLASTDPATYYRALSGLARQGHHDVLQPLPYTPSLEFHDPSCVVIEPRPANTDTIELYANAAYPNFPWLLERFRDPVVAERLDAVYQLVFNEGTNVAVVTNHGQIIDIALVGGAMIDAMCSAGRHFGVLGEEIEVEDLAARMNVLVSRMVTTRMAFNIPAMQVLQCGARTFLSVPQTHSRRRAKLDPALVRANNQLMRHELDIRLSEGGQLLAMAASGSQDLSVAVEMVQKMKAQWRQLRGFEPDDSLETVHLQPLYDGTINLMLGCKFVLPIAVALDPARPALEVGALTRVREKNDCHLIMEWIADAHQEATGLPTIYHRREDDLLTQVRSIVKI
ncbi:hypothetical protein [Dermatobacter hominis]|uniref:hypothetical protein n=1 Tax=Dermatobacter hominis TaxID=2884263 RepID=UPI001D0F79CE|nr:hypothetical protein [Dermatobacter hominis]UDY36170.1 hypothetical protein LH044_01220 [Dermatobacter hominis]